MTTRVFACSEMGGGDFDSPDMDYRSRYTPRGGNGYEHFKLHQGVFYSGKHPSDWCKASGEPINVRLNHGRVTASSRRDAEWINPSGM